MEAWQTLEHILVRCGVALVLLSVWTWRLKRATKFRGKNAQSLEEEFKVYGLSKKTMYVIGTLKILISVCFLMGHWAPFLIRPAAAILAAIMFMAVLYHFKVENKNYFKALPAYLVLLFATYLVIM
jgi:uncharacterized membrane protein YphA (DoxX/SURF4 family)